jgi:hypothetical protein
MGCLVAGDRVGAGARPAHRAADLDAPQDGDELRTVGGLPGGEHEGQRTAAPLGRQVHLAGQPSPRTPQGSGLQPRAAASADQATLGTGGVGRVGILSPFLILLVFPVAPFDCPMASSSAARTSSLTRAPAAS